MNQGGTRDEGQKESVGGGGEKKKVETDWRATSGIKIRKLIMGGVGK